MRITLGNVCLLHNIVTQKETNTARRINILFICPSTSAVQTRRGITATPPRNRRNDASTYLWDSTRLDEHASGLIESQNGVEGLSITVEKVFPRVTVVIRFARLFIS